MQLLRRAGFHALVLLAYTAVALVLTYPLAFVGDSAIVGNRIAAKDGWQTVWDIWWWRQGLVYQPERPLLTHYIYWPTGVDMLAYRAYGLTSMLQATPVLLLFGPLAAYTFNMVLNFALSGYTMFLLARRLVGGTWPALAAGLVFTASPFHLSRFADGYHDLTALQWLPLYALALALWLEQGRLRYAFGALLVLAALLLSSAYYTQFALVWTACAALVWGLRARGTTSADDTEVLHRQFAARDELQARGTTSADDTEVLHRQFAARDELQARGTTSADVTLNGGAAGVKGLLYAARTASLRLAQLVAERCPWLRAWLRFIPDRDFGSEDNLPVGGNAGDRQASGSRSGPTALDRLYSFFTGPVGRVLLPPLRVALLLGAWGVLCLPIIRRMAGASIGYNDFLLRQELHSFDLLDLVLPSDIHPLWAALGLHRLTHPYGSWNVVPGTATLLAGCWGLWLARRHLWPWMVLGLAMLLFAMGPTLFVAGHPLEWLPMPHDALNLFGAGRASQRPNHFLVFALIVLALGVAVLLSRCRPQVAFGLTALIVAIDCVPPLPWPVLPAPAPAWESLLAELPPGAVIELPYRPREIDYQVTQLRHGRPIIGGYVSRVPPYPLNNHDALRRLAGTKSETIADTDIPAQTKLFASSLCARALVLHPRFTQVSAADLKNQVARTFPAARLVYDQDALVYLLPEPTEAAPLLVLDDGWYSLERDGERRWQWSMPQATMHLINPRAAPMLARLDITMYAAENEQPARLLLDGRVVWQGSVGARPVPLSLWLRLPAQGSIALLLESEGPRRGRPLGLALAALAAHALPGQILPCPVASPLDPGLPR